MTIVGLTRWLQQVGYLLSTSPDQAFAGADAGRSERGKSGSRLWVLGGSLETPAETRGGINGKARWPVPVDRLGLFPQGQAGERRGIRAELLCGFPSRAGPVFRIWLRERQASIPYFCSEVKSRKPDAGWLFSRSCVCVSGSDFANLAFVDRAKHPLTLTRARRGHGFIQSRTRRFCVAFARSNRRKRQRASRNNLEIFHDGILATARRNELHLCALLHTIGTWCGTGRVRGSI